MIWCLLALPLLETTSSISFQYYCRINPTIFFYIENFKLLFFFFFFFFGGGGSNHCKKSIGEQSGVPDNARGNTIENWGYLFVHACMDIMYAIFYFNLTYFCVSSMFDQVPNFTKLNTHV